MTLICVGRLKERAFRELADEYLKRLSRYGPVEEIEIPDLKDPGGNETLSEQVRTREGEGILKALRPSDYVIALTISGRSMDSPALADHLRLLRTKSAGRIVWIVGGSLGLGRNVLERANEELSMSRMTFPHQLARVMLLEQLYRAEKILAGERYHK